MNAAVYTSMTGELQVIVAVSSSAMELSGFPAPTPHSSNTSVPSTTNDGRARESGALPDVESSTQTTLAA